MEALEEITNLEIEATEKVAKLKSAVIKKRLELNRNLLKSESSSNRSQISVKESIATEVKNDQVKDWLAKQRCMNKNKIDDERKFKTEFPKNNINFQQSRCSSYREDRGEDENEPMNNNFLARQAFNKELPYFGGDPMEWPMFISFYRESNRACRYSNAENMCRLQKCLRGSAKESVQMLLLQPENVNKVIDTLEFRFGRTELIISQLIDKAKQLKPPREDKFDSIMGFAIAVQNLSAMLVNFRSIPHLMNPQLLNELVGKLPCALQLRWGELLFNNRDKYATIENFSDWLMDIAKATSMVVTQSSYVPASTKENFDRKQSSERQNKIKKFPMYTVVDSKEKSGEKVDLKSIKNCEYCDDKNHKIDLCRKFTNLTIDERWEFVMKKGMCWSCLKRYHRYKDCSIKQKCGINDCKLSHHALLHKDKLISVQDTRIETQTSCHTVPMDGKEMVLFKILPVKLYGPKGTVDTYAFLDDGSSVTLLEDKIAKQLGYDGERTPLCLKWTGNTFKTEERSQKIVVEISGVGENDKVFEMSNVRTVDYLNLPSQSLDFDEVMSKYPHLKGLHVKNLNNAVPGLLIGINQTKLGIYDDVKEADNVDIVAVKTKIGWVIYGKDALQTSGPSFENFSFHVCECEPSDASLHQMTKKYFSTEDFGVKIPEKPLESLENSRALEILDATVKRIENSNHFETGLLWKYDHINLPKSYNMAERRLSCIERKMDKDKAFADAYCSKIQEYVDKGYAKKLSIEEAAIETPRTWYLPHFGVINPNKPEKLRLVFDAAAKSEGISLNDVLLKGPDRYNSLLGVLYKFRQRKFAICGDIREMFHQVLIREDDLQAQRFLWRGPDRDRNPDVYVMNAMIFGSASSPCCAQEIKNRNALEFIEEFPVAVEAILKNHYVDDYLDSFDTEEEALQVLEDVTHVHKQGGFEITNWFTNSQQIINKLQKSNTVVKELNFEDDDSSERVLGMVYSLESDNFQFKLKFHKVDKALLNYERKPTKREVLRILMSIFDPIGFLAQFTVYMKVLIQSIWTSGIGWDDVLPDSLYEKWKLWMEELPKVKDLRIPRCYSTFMTEGSVIELHTFVDASEAAFSAVSYLRFEDTSGNVTVAFVGGKTRVAPQKMLSIPRLELQAAVLGARLVVMIETEHTIKIDRKIYWSDSRTVLCWLRSDARGYKQFVGHRISEALDISDVKSWRWLPTKLNVADDATKWVKVPVFDLNSRWYSGPEFLRLSEAEWPIESPTTNSLHTDEEKKPNYVGVIVKFQPDVPLPDPTRFSKYERYIRSTAWIMRYISNCYYKSKSKKTCNTELQADEIRYAEEIVLKKVQSEMYKSEITQLERKI